METENQIHSTSNTIKMSTEKKVMPKDLVKVWWTGSDTFHKAGQTSMVHTVQAEKLVASGQASMKEVKEEKAKDEKPK